MLEQMQSEFRRFALGGGADRLAARVAPSEGAARLLEIHRANVLLPLIESLSSTYPMVERAMGHETFRLIAADFVRQRPPRRPQLSAYGGGFAAHLERLPALPDGIGDLARLEWCRHDAYFAANAVAVTAQALSGVAPDEVASLRFRLHPSAQLRTLAIGVASAWQALAAGGSWPGACAGPECVVVWRADRAVLHRALAPSEWAFLRSLRRGAGLAFAAAIAAGAPSENAPFDLASTLAFCLAGGLLLAPVGIDALAAKP